MPAPSKRERIVTIASRLFAERGFHGTGVDRVVEEAGVSKKTLYSHFRSKDELILAVLSHYDSSFRNGFMRQVEAAAPDAKGRLLAVFDVAAGWFREDAFYGCLFVKATGEYTASDSALRRVCQSYKRQMRDYIHSLAVEAGCESPDVLADQLALLLEGAVATAQVSGTDDAATTAQAVARKLLDE